MILSLIRRQTAIGLLASAALVTSCHEVPTVPFHLVAIGKANHDALTDAAEMAPAEASGSVSLGESQFLGHYPQRTKVLARVSGSTMLTDGVETFTYGLWGHPYAGGRVLPGPGGPCRRARPAARQGPDHCGHALGDRTLARVI